MNLRLSRPHRMVVSIGETDKYKRSCTVTRLSDDP